MIALMILITAFYSYDTTDRFSRTCYYNSPYGTHVITIPVTSLCPLSIEVDV